MSDAGKGSGLFGLVLAGGRSRRMQRDKATLEFEGRSQLERAYAQLKGVCERVFVSVRPDQAEDALRNRFPQIVDVHEDVGPLAGILAAQRAHPDVAWLVLACDLPLVDDRTLQHLTEHRNVSAFATAFRSASDGLPEPLCAIFEPRSGRVIEDFLAADTKCPRKILIRSPTHLLEPLDAHALDNVNTPEDLGHVRGRMPGLVGSPR